METELLHVWKLFKRSMSERYVILCEMRQTRREVSVDGADVEGEITVVEGADVIDPAVMSRRRVYLGSALCSDGEYLAVVFLTRPPVSEDGVLVRDSRGWTTFPRSERGKYVILPAFGVFTAEDAKEHLGDSVSVDMLDPVAPLWEEELVSLGFVFNSPSSSSSDSDTDDEGGRMREYTPGDEVYFLPFDRESVSQPVPVRECIVCTEHHEVHVRIECLLCRGRDFKGNYICWDAATGISAVSRRRGLDSVLCPNCMSFARFVPSDVTE